MTKIEGEKAAWLLAITICDLEKLYPEKSRFGPIIHDFGQLQILIQ